MILLITGASHTGKTVLAQRLLERYHYPYLSIDHLKMGLIRTGHTALTPESDDGALTVLLWPVVREMVKTAIENGQHLIVEGCYIPGDWAAEFPPDYRAQIRYLCLVMSESYIRRRFDAIEKYADAVEHRLTQDFTLADALADNARVREDCCRYGNPYVWIDGSYESVYDDCIRELTRQGAAFGREESIDVDQ